MKYSEVKETVGMLRELADFIEAYGVALPSFSIDTRIRVYLSEYSYDKNPESGEWESKLNEDATKQNIKKLLEAIGSCEKDYQGDSLKITKKFPSFPNETMVYASVDRSVTCKKVVKGQKLQQAYYSPAKLVDEYEWVCDEDTSLLKMVK